MKYLVMIRSNIRKNVSASIILVVLIIVSTVMLYIGGSVCFRIGNFIDEKNEVNNGADFISFSNKEDTENLVELIYGMNHVVDVETQEMIMYPSISIRNLTKQDEYQSINLMLINADDKAQYSKMNLSEHGESLRPNSIILPYYMKVTSGYEIGDTIELMLSDEDWIYEIYGFSEDSMYANIISGGILKGFLYQDEFEQLKARTPMFAAQDFVKVKLTQGTSSLDFDAAFVKETAKSTVLDGSLLFGINYEILKIGNTQTMLIFMSIMIAFAVIIIIVATVIIRFTIITHIEENIKNIGSLLAMGYTKNQIIHSLVLQYCSIAVVAYVIGFIVAQACSGIVTAMVSFAVGLKWENHFNLLVAILSFVIILFIVLLITLQTAYRLKKVTPIMALRNGINTHEFKKNYLPLEKSSGSLNCVIGLKTLLHNKKQNIAMGIISSLIALTMFFALVMYQNFIVNDTAFIQLIGMETADVAISCQSENSDELSDALSLMDEVVQVRPYDMLNLNLCYQDKEHSTAVAVCDDFSKVLVDTIVQGRNPIHENEIAISNIVCKVLGAGLGDTITLNYKENQCDYIVVGIKQHFFMLGDSASMTIEGMKQLDPNYKEIRYHVYLKEGTNSTDFIKACSSRLTMEELQYEEVYSEIDEMLNSIHKAITIMVAVIIIVTGSVVMMTMHFLVKVKLLSEKMLIGINKSLGFTTKQLIEQTVISFCPVVMVGALIGGILGFYLVDPMCKAIFSIAGISKTNLNMPMGILFISFLFVTLLSIITTIVSAIRIKRIHPKEMLM